MYSNHSVTEVFDDRKKKVVYLAFHYSSIDCVSKAPAEIDMNPGIIIHLRLLVTATESKSAAYTALHFFIT